MKRIVALGIILLALAGCQKVSKKITSIKEAEMQTVENAKGLLVGEIFLHEAITIIRKRK